MRMFYLVVVLAVSALLLSAVDAQTIPEEARRHMARGQAAVEMAKSSEDYEAAIREFQEAARLAPDWPDPYFNLGLVQEKAGKFREAIASLNRYFQLAPNAPDAAKIQEQIYKLEYKAEQVLSVSDIIDVLVSFSNWEKAGGQCIDSQLATIKRKDNNSVKYKASYSLEGGDSYPVFDTEEIKGRVFNMRQTISCGDTGRLWSSCHFRSEAEIEVVSKTHVKVRQTVTRVEQSPIRPPVANGEYFCEYRKR